MKLKNMEIFNAKAPLEQLVAQKFPVKVSYALAKLAKAVNEPLVVIEQVRAKLIQQYGTVAPDNPQAFQVLPVLPGENVTNPNWEKFNAELGELMSKEEEVEFDMVTLPEMVASTCDKCNHNMDRPLEIEPAILMMLDKFVTVE